MLHNGKPLVHQGVSLFLSVLTEEHLGEFVNSNEIVT